MDETLQSRFSANAQHAVALLKAMANYRRLLVLCHLIGEGELSVGQLQDRIGLSQSALSQHLSKLREEGLVATRKQSQTVFYTISDPKAAQVLALLHDVFCPELGKANDDG